MSERSVSRTVQVACVLLVVSTLAFAYAARHKFFGEAYLIGDWQHSYHDYFYPKYATTLSIRSDKTFAKIEEYTERKGATKVVSTFEGVYTLGSNGLEPGQIAFHIHEGTSKRDGEIVASGPVSGITAICHYAFDVRGNLIITDMVNGMDGNRKNPEELPPNTLIPSFEHYRRAGSSSVTPATDSG